MVYKTPTYANITLESNNGLSNLRGTIAMARTSVADSASTQFFINQADNLFLNYSSSASPGYAVFGRVVSGLSVIDRIAVVPRNSADKPTSDITITSVQQTASGSAFTAAGASIAVSDLEVGASWRYSLDSGQTWAAGEGSSFAVPAGSYAANAIQVSQTDAAGNQSLGTGTLPSALVAQADASRVVVTMVDALAGTATLNTPAVVYTLGFSEPVTGLDAADFTVMNGAVQVVSGSGDVWTVSVKPDSGLANGAISVLLKAGAVTGASGAYNTSAVNSSQLLDTLAPVPPKLVGNAALSYLQAPQVTLQTSKGALVVELYPEKAPHTVANFLANANSGFYDATLFHSVTAGFVVQAGAFSSTTLAYKTPTYSTVTLESNNTLLNQYGSVAMLRTGSSVSDGAQFFFNLADNPSINYASATSPGYAVFGKVVSGMSVIDSMGQAELSATGLPLSPITLSSMQQTQAGIASTSTGSLSVSELASGASWSYSLDSGAHWLAGSGNSLVLPAGDYGPNTIWVRQADALGNTSQAQSSFSSALVVGSTMTMQATAYSWKSHTLLGEVALSTAAFSHRTAADGSATWQQSLASSVSLTASRAIPADEADITRNAVNLQDAIAILKMVVGLDVNGAGKPLSPYQALAADYDGNGVVQLSDAIGVLKHVVGLSTQAPVWHFVHEIDPLVPAKASLLPGAPQASIPIDTGAAGSIQVGLVGYLSGDVDGSFSGAPGALDLDTLQAGYFTALTTAHNLSLSQFGVYGGP
jgi:cyclophilin family peptidyl-prolyl cis-trans isomerase